MARLCYRVNAIARNVGVVRVFDAWFKREDDEGGRYAVSRGSPSPFRRVACAG